VYCSINKKFYSKGTIKLKPPRLNKFSPQIWNLKFEIYSKFFWVFFTLSVLNQAAETFWRDWLPTFSLFILFVHYGWKVWKLFILQTRVGASWTVFYKTFIFFRDIIYASAKSTCVLSFFRYFRCHLIFGVRQENNGLIKILQFKQFSTLHSKFSLARKYLMVLMTLA